MKCACGNAARYIDETGAMVCSLCPIKAKLDAIRIAEVPGLLEWARTFDYLMTDEGRALAMATAKLSGLTFEDVLQNARSDLRLLIGRNTSEQ